MTDRMIRGLSPRLPMDRQAYGHDADAHAARAAEDVPVVLILPQEFWLGLPGSDPVLLTLICPGGLTMAESPLTGALPGMLEAGAAAAMPLVGLATAQGADAGHAATSTREIAHRAGVGASTIRGLFASTSDL